jgi:hypothetical protein
MRQKKLTEIEGIRAGAGKKRQSDRSGPKRQETMHHPQPASRLKPVDATFACVQKKKGNLFVRQRLAFDAQSLPSFL